MHKAAAPARPSITPALVIGAGVIGSGIALELARAGYPVTVVDTSGGPGQGSTSASSAVVRYHYRHLDEAVVAWESGRRWAAWTTYLGAEDPAGTARFIQTGLLLVAGEELDIEAALAHLASVGATVEELDGDEVRARFPSLDPARIGPPSRPEDDAFWGESRGDCSAYWMPECGYVDDPSLAAHNLAHAARVHGAAFRFRSSVTEVLSVEGHVSGVRLGDGSTLEAGVVVNAAGPWSSTVNALAGVLDDFHTSTRPLEQEVVSLSAPEGFGVGAGGVCVTDADFGTYFRPHGEETMIIGGMEPACDPLVWLERAEDARDSVSRETWDTQTLRVARRLPGTRIPHRSSGVVGVYDVTDDWIPIYDRTSLGGFYVAIGTSGHGFKQAPFVGELMARLVVACEAGHPHDDEPLVVPATWTGHEVDLGHFSRLRDVVSQRAMAEPLHWRVQRERTRPEVGTPVPAVTRTWAALC